MGTGAYQGTNRDLVCGNRESWKISLGCPHSQRSQENSTLFNPAHGQRHSQLFKRQIRRLTTIEDSLHNIWGKKSVAKNATNVALVETGLLADRARPARLACD